MKTTKIFYLAVTTVLLSVLATGCIPTGGGPTPTVIPPQTDSSVIYHLSNKLVVNLTPTNTILQGDSIDLDSNGTIDISFWPYNGNYGSAVTKIYSMNEKVDLAIKNYNDHVFLLNDMINYTYFPHNPVIFGIHNNGTTTKFIGFRLQKPDGYHYGWMQLKMQAVFLGSAPFATATTIKTTLINYAYKKASNTPIAAGAY